MEKEKVNYCSAREDDESYVWMYNRRQGDFLTHEARLKRVPYRWENRDTDDEQFQVFFNGVWNNAQSIDFNFHD